MPADRLRPLTPSDDAEIRRIWRATIALGKPAPPWLRGLEPYEHLCLGWYLSEARDTAAVLERDGRVAGYVLICVDPRTLARWSRRAGAAYVASVTGGVATGKLRGPSRRFHQLRLADGWYLWRHGANGGALPHAHFNLRAGERTGLTGLRLVRYVDDVCRDAGFHAWHGEMNATYGRRADAIARYGGTILERTPNKTLTWLAGEPVERMRVECRVDVKRPRSSAPSMPLDGPANAR